MAAVETLPYITKCICFISWRAIGHLDLSCSFFGMCWILQKDVTRYLKSIDRGSRWRSALKQNMMPLKWQLCKSENSQILSPNTKQSCTQRDIHRVDREIFKLGMSSCCRKTHRCSTCSIRRTNYSTLGKHFWYIYIYIYTLYIWYIYIYVYMPRQFYWFSVVKRRDHL